MSIKIYKIIVFILLLHLFSCQEKATTEINNSTDTVEEAPPPRLFLNTKTRRLRVRETPDIEGAVLKILGEDLIVEYMHDSTQFTTEITYNRQDYNAHWYKILTVDKVEGWVYAAFVEFLPDEENQKVVIQRETAELLEAANEKQPQISQKQKKELAQPVNNSLVSTYTTYLSGLSKNDPNSIQQAIARFSATFVGHANVRTCDAGYVTFHNFYIQTLNLLRRSNISSYQHLLPEIRRYQMSTMQQDDYTRTLAANGFNFGIADGKVVLAEDVDFLYRIFYRECSTPMRAYMNQYQLEEPNFWLDQDKMLITPKNLARWVLSWNYFIATYPDFIWYADAKKRLENQLNILLQGSPKSPAFDPKTFTLSADFVEAYRHIVDNYPESKIGRAFKEYLDILETNDWKSSSEVTQGQNKIIRTFVL